MTTPPVKTQDNSGSGWGWLVLAGLFEVGFTYALKMEQQDKSYLGLFIVCAILSFEFLSRSLKSIPVSLAYAVWTGIGSVGAVVVGLLVFNENLSPIRILLLIVLISAILGLKLADGRENQRRQ